MKRGIRFIAMALAVVLSAGTLVGCGQNASSTSSSVASTSSATSEQATSDQSKDEVIAELKSAAAKTPEFKSVTVKESTAWNYVDGDASEPKAVEAMGAYKFDMSGDQLKESITAEYEGEKLQYFTDGNNAVFVSDGTAYSGTTEQFGTQDYSGFDTFVAHVVGDLETLVGCASSAEKMESKDLTLYMLSLDPQKYIATDPTLTMLSEAGMPVKDAILTIGFDKGGNVASMIAAINFEDSGLVETLEFSDFDSTVVDPTPEATKTYEQMDKDMQQQIEQLMKELDAFDASANA